MTQSTLRIAAIDVGGTFTDACLLRDGELHVCKLPSTPDDPGRAVASALRRLGGADLLVHGTTVATNALLQGKLAKIVFITTKGMRDVLAIGRQQRRAEDLYSLAPRARNELVPRSLRLECDERLGPSGEVERKLTTPELRRLKAAVRKARPEAIAICLLHSYANPEHEAALAKALEPLGLPVVQSSQLAPEFREYERSLVTAANAGLIPILRDYIAGLEKRVAPTRVVLMHSAGGWLPAAIAALEPVRLALSGPAGGLNGARAALDAEGFARGIALDVGGTSTDVSFITEQPRLRPETPIAGLPLRTPSLDIHTIGAGGGSLAWFDQGGALQVGPQSAGADPGPACYGRGGKHATLTDALVVLGRIPPELKLGGEMALNPQLARKAIRKLDPEAPASQIAEAVLRVALAGIERALRRVSVERGHDSRGMPLVPFGGAGGLLACDLAELLGMDRVLVPRAPGLLSALGMLQTPASRDLSRTLFAGEGDDPWRRATGVADQLERRAKAELRDCGIRSRLRARRSVDVRYLGQSYELNVPLTANWKRAFSRAHRLEYSFDHDELAVEIVAVRVRVEAAPPVSRLPAGASPERPTGAKSGTGASPEGPTGAKSGTGASPERPTGARSGTGASPERPTGARSGTGASPVRVYARESLGVGARLSGPAIVTELSSCLYLKAGWNLRATKAGQLLLHRGGR